MFVLLEMDLNAYLLLLPELQNYEIKCACLHKMRAKEFENLSFYQNS